MKRIAGVDGCRSGWLVVESNASLSACNWKIASQWNTIATDAEVIAVDMPIGISSNGVRQCEVEARNILSSCASRVFKTLPRGALRFSLDEWGKANQWSKDSGFGGISKQIWNIRGKILEIDAEITRGSQQRVFEAHPELAFARCNGGRPFVSKHSAEGIRIRRRLLEREGFGSIGTWIKELRGSGAKVDDLLDACALVLTARHIALGTALMLPDRVERDERGLRMSISY